MRYALEDEQLVHIQRRGVFDIWLHTDHVVHSSGHTALSFAIWAAGVRVLGFSAV